MTDEQILGDYRVIKQMGQGPTGAVYLAEHRFIKRQYVLKVLPQELTQDRLFLQRFEEEVVKLAQLEHPHLVKIHNVSFADGTYFLVTDCVVDSIGETTTLAQYMAGRNERLREEELLSLSRQVASALDYLHEKGVCHLGLKLNNILIGKGKPGIDIFLSDIALTRILHPAAIVARSFHAVCEALETFPVQITKTGEERYAAHPIEGEKRSKLAQGFLQAFAFLAPEQKRMQPLTRASDVYAFGVLLYYLITGEFPEGILPSVKEQARLYQHDWDGLIHQCLAMAPEQRPLKLLPLIGQKSSPLGAFEAPLREQLSPDREPSDLSELVAQLPEVHEEVAAPRLKPIIHRQLIESMASASVAPMELAEKRDLAEATAPAMTPMSDHHVPSIGDILGNREPIVKEYHPEQKEQHLQEPIATEMVCIPAAHYMRGNDEGNRDEAPYHRVELAAFAIDIHPVTNEQFVRFLNYMGGEKDQHYNDLIRLKDARINRAAGKLTIESGYSKHPVVGVTWYGAVAYAQWIGKRLPTEAEWEIAARGQQESCPYPTGKNIEKTQANFFSSDTTPVMSYAANAYGIYDLAGNVYEWCQDWYGYNYYETTAQEPCQPKGPLQGVYRVLRGGCWKSLKEDLRCSHRHRNSPGTVNRTYGFRCVTDVQEI